MNVMKECFTTELLACCVNKKFPVEVQVNKCIKVSFGYYSEAFSLSPRAASGLFYCLNGTKP